VADHLGEQQRRSAVELFHQASGLEMRIDGRRIGLQTPALGHAAERGAEAGVEDRVGKAQTSP